MSTDSTPTTDETDDLNTSEHHSLHNNNPPLDVLWIIDNGIDVLKGVEVLKALYEMLEVFGKWPNLQPSHHVQNRIPCLGDR